MSAPSSAIRRRGLWWLVGAFVLVALVAFAWRRIDLDRLVRELGHAHGWWIAAATIAYASVLPLWAVQWTLLVPGTPGARLGPMLRLVALDSAIYTTGVTLAGEAAALALLVRRIGVDHATAVSVLMMDQLLVGIAKAVVLATASLAMPIPGPLRAGMLAFAVGLLLLAVVVGTVAWGHGSIAQRLPPRIGALLRRAGDALAPIRAVNRGAGALALALVKIGTQVVAVLCVQQAFDAPVGAGAALLVVAALSLATMLPVTPGSVGVFEATVVLVYTHLGLDAETALGMGIVLHAASLLALAAPGLIVLIAERSGV